MRELWLACGMLVFLIVAVCVGGAQRKEHFAQDEKFDGKKLDRVVDDIYRNLNIGFATDDRFAEWSDTGKTNADGYDTLTLPFSYANTNYFVTASGTTVALLATGVISDSTFWVCMFGTGGSGLPNQSFRYLTVGQR